MRKLSAILVSFALLLPTISYAQVFNQSQIFLPPYGSNGFVVSTSTSLGAKLSATSTPYFSSICFMTDGCRTTWPTGMVWPWTKQADGSQGTTTLMSLIGGFESAASSSINSTLTVSGTVGIGTTNPIATLNVTKTGPQWTTTGYSKSLYLGDGTDQAQAFGINGVTTNFGWGVSGTTLSQFYTTTDIDTGDSAHVYMTVNSSGTVGIGTTTPATDTKVILSIASSTAPQLRLSDGVAGSSPFNFRQIGSTLYIATSSQTSFATSTTASLVLNGTNGNTLIPQGYVGIGTTNPTGTLHVYGKGESYPIIVESGGSVAAGLKLMRTTNGGTVGVIDTYQGSTRIGQLENSTEGTNGGYYAFWTKADGGSLAEQLRIKGNGNVGIGTTNPGFNLSASSTVGITGQTWIFDSTAAGVGDDYICKSTTKQLHEGATCAASTRKIKDNILSISTTTALAQVIALNPVTFTYKPGFYRGRNDLGFIAEEVAAVNPLLALNAEATSTFQVGTTTQSVPAGQPMALNPNALISLLTGAIKGLASKISLGPSGTTTIDVAKLQINTTNTAGQAVCGLVVNRALVFSTGKCNP